MKVVKRENCKLDFDPFDIVITIESREDFDLLHSISCMNMTIPKLLDRHERENAVELLDNIRNLLL